ncbi:MAG: tRNA (guanosine(37)-N1)-methyltransferase TrmD [Chlamydiae bacterium]|nr:tRNA (guanosine(37)-N1)-methyltransferase TrmD [Chlamydiota bacterium]
MKFDILSLFPEYFAGPLDVSIVKRARENGLIDISLTNIRDFAEGKHKKVDDKPFGGGPGMVLMPEPVSKAIKSVRKENSYVVYLSPQGNVLTAAKCLELSRHEHVVLLCGHYEGVDDRVVQSHVDEEISIGDYVLTNGCIAAIVLLDAVIRFIPGVIGNEQGVLQDSFQNGIFEAPQYTKPDDFEGMRVPQVLKTGNHALIKKWREEEALKKTCRVRRDLVDDQRRNQ